MVRAIFYFLIYSRNEKLFNVGDAPLRVPQNDERMKALSKRIIGAVLIIVLIMCLVLLVACSGAESQITETVELIETGELAELLESPHPLRITASQAKEIIDNENDVLIIDVRSPEEFATGFIMGAISVPLNEIEATASIFFTYDQIILIYCRSGNRSFQAALILSEMGFNSVYDFGGILDWYGEIITETSNITSVITEAPIIEEPTFIDENENEPESTLTLRPITQNAGLLYLAEGFNIHVALPYYKTRALHWESPDIVIPEGHFLKFTSTFLPVWAMPPWPRLFCTVTGEDVIALIFEEFEGFNDSGLFEHRAAWIRHGTGRYLEREWGLLNTFGEWVIPPTFTQIHEGFRSAGGFTEGLALVRPYGELWGFVDMYGNMIVPPIYNSLQPFNNGLAAGMQREGHSERYFLINPSGEQVAEFDFMPTYLGNGLVQRWRGGVYNFSGEPIEPVIIIPPAYSLIQRIGANRFIVNIRGSGERDAPREYIILDMVTGERITLPHINSFYFSSWRSGDDMLVASFHTEEGERQIGIINEWGLISTDEMADIVRIEDFANGLAVVRNDNNEFGVINTIGEFIVPFGRYTNILGFGDVLSAVSTRKENNVLWGFIDTTGREIIPPMYGGLYIMHHPPYAISQTHYNPRPYSVFINGTAVIQCPETLLWGIVDNTGREIVTPAFDTITHFIGDFALANIGGLGASHLPWVRGGTWYIIDRNNEIIASFDYGRMYHIGENLFNFSYYPQYQIMDYWYEWNSVVFYDYDRPIMFGGWDDIQYNWQLLILYS